MIRVNTVRHGFSFKPLLLWGGGGGGHDASPSYLHCASSDDHKIS